MTTPQFSRALLLLWLGGCDPPVVGDQAALTVCTDACKESGVSATDRATCRLNCEASHKVTPFPPRPPVLAPIAHCMGACGQHGAADATASKACVDACRDQDTAPAVLDALSACVTGCQVANRTDDDRATCRLHCAQNDPSAP